MVFPRESSETVFADTFYWIALTNPADLHSQVAMSFDDLLSGGRVTTTEEFTTAAPTVRYRPCAAKG
jgi:hypothetical protein